MTSATNRCKWADTLFREYIRERDKTCQMESAECWGELQAAHFVGRGRKSVRWHRDNACLLCEEHHRRLDTDPIGKHSFFADRLGEERFTALHMKSREAFDRDYDRVIRELRELRRSQKGSSTAKADNG